MAEDWQALQASITTDLKTEGREFIFTRQVPGEWDPIASCYAPGETKQFVANGIFRSLGSMGLGSAYGFEWKMDTTIAKGDKVILADCSTYTPAHGDSLNIDGEDWVVVSWAFLEPGGPPLLQYLLIRRA